MRQKAAFRREHQEFDKLERWHASEQKHALKAEEMHGTPTAKMEEKERKAKMLYVNFIGVVVV